MVIKFIDKDGNKTIHAPIVNFEKDEIIFAFGNDIGSIKYENIIYISDEETEETPVNYKQITIDKEKLEKLNNVLGWRIDCSAYNPNPYRKN